MVPGESLVSVIMATHNGSRFIGEAISSVLGQTHRNFEFIIVDDASTDGVGELIESFRDGRISLISNDKQLGLTKSLNRGIRRTRGEFVARIDDDDVWANRDKLEKQVSFMQKNRRVGVCGVQNIVIDERGNELYRLHYEVNDKLIRQQMLRGNQFPHAGVLLRRLALEKVGLYDEGCRYAQDFELWLRIGLKYELAGLPDVYIKQRVNLQGLTASSNMRQFLAFVRIAYTYRDRYPGFWANWLVYMRELVINLVPKPIFYRWSGWRRRSWWRCSSKLLSWFV